MNFKEKLLIEYPIPETLSVWGGDDIDTNEVGDLGKLIESCVDELSSDVLITCYESVGQMVTILPEGTVSVVSAKLGFQFQGNKFVKFTYTAGTRKVAIRHYPAEITYRRMLKVEDLENLKGDLLRYTKAYILSKMASKEVTLLQSVDLHTDNGAVNLTALSNFGNECLESYKTLKPEILIYASTC